MLDVAAFILENWPAKSKIITEICAQIQNHQAAVLGTQNPEPWPSPESASPLVSPTQCNSVLPSAHFNSEYYNFDRSSLYQLGYLMLPKRKC